MALPLEDYALIGDTQSVALVGIDGSIDWMCLPHFDSGACFASLLGDPSNGRWLIAPRDPSEVTRRMRPGTSILETTFRTQSGVVRLTDAMPPRHDTPDVIRVLECLEGEITMQLELLIRFDYGSVMPWVSRCSDGRLRAVAGSDALVLQSSIEVQGDGPRTVAEYGEVLDALHQARCAGLPCDDAWALETKLLTFLEGAWSEPDEGMWEVRGPRRHFTHSKVMTWVAFDRAVKSIEEQGMSGPVEHWRSVRDTIHADVCAKGFHAGKQSFTQSYGSDALDANLLLLVQVGFLSEDDPRIVSTVAAIERELLVDGYLLRYRTDEGLDGLPPGEGAFLACSFWLADTYALMGRQEDAEALFARLLAVRNDVGLLAEEFDPTSKRLLGNFPQAFSHVGLVNTAFNLSAATRKPAHERKKR